ncbi:FAD-binding protein [Micrococcus sp. ACRRV]|uniref:FAD-binding oxidoreductase n=1 Tax=Micrococcus sp. ACRRV TaxID=2918203 RepID=UPI001EF1D9CE|nr:FAD-linked oxidase C-terminal domain-containing protein [Micrococcus sp. ACRRV]MCG7422530.1 FAD-binding protein [Micrococcus sp. ACRRV]
MTCIISVSPDDVLHRLRAALGDAVVTDPAALEPLRADRSGHRSPGAPLAAVRARTVEDVQAACRIAHATGTPLVTRGAGTGLAGGAVAGPGQVVLDLSGMDRILEVAPEDRVAVVEPGVLNGALNRALEPHGLWWAPDPASKEISTVGGNIAMNAGGLLCAKYGVTREAVLGLAVVLADGTLMRLGHRTVKGVTGYDLTALMIGSEGTLGVIVEATLALRPLPEGVVHTLGAFFPDVALGARAAAAITGAGHVPAIMELMDEATLAAVRAHVSADDAARLPETGAFLLVQADGAGADGQAAAMAELIRSAGGEVTVTADPAEADRLVSLRRTAFPALEALGTPLVEDVAVPRSRMTEMFARIREIEAETGLRIPTSAHAGDGNLHPVVLFGEPSRVGGEDGAQEAIPAEVWAAAGMLFRAGLELGGTLTGEHGVGLLKRAFLKEELGEAQHGLQERIKAVFDPRGILNPGIVFTP